MTVQHASDCALHNAPALPVAPCDCEALTERERDLLAALMGFLSLSPSDERVGWRGSPAVGDPRETYACEFCGGEHFDCILIAHADDCPVTSGRAAISKAVQS